MQFGFELWFQSDSAEGDTTFQLEGLEHTEEGATEEDMTQLERHSFSKVRSGKKSYGGN